MSNPLTPEQIELLRSLPRIVLDDDIHDLTDSVLAVNDFQEGDDYFIRTRAGDTLLATIDSETQRAVTAERERVLAEIDASLRAFHRHFMLEVATLFEIDAPAAKRLRALAQEFFETTKHPEGEQ